VLSALEVHVVGGYDPQRPERCVVPLRDRAGQTGAVCVALPYVHEFRLGVRTTDPDPDQVRASYADRFGALYRQLCDLALALHPGLPLVATGHLTMGPARAEDYPQAIHQVGSLDALPESLVDPRIQYLALGHIHRSYPVAGRRGWYCGTPVATSLPEAALPRRVLRVDLAAEPGGQAVVTPLLVPRARALLRLQGDPDSLCAQLSALSWDDPLPPLVFAVVALDAPAPDLVPRLEAALSVHPEGRRPRVARLEVAAAVAPGGAPPAPDLAQLRPEDVLDQLCARAGVTEADALRGAFAALASATPEDWADRLRQVEAGAL
jgi:exonuclease SbcD